MTLAWAAALLAAAAGALPVGEARYRVEVGGAAVGVAEYSVSCPAVAQPAAVARCTLRWETRLRLPAEAGGAVRAHRIVAVVDREGRTAGAVTVDLDGARRAGAAGAGTYPASAAELVLSGTDAPACVAVVDEESGQTGRACARRAGGQVIAEVLGVVEEVTPGGDGFPERVELPAQRTRFVRDPAATAPSAPPPLEVRVAGPAAPLDARRFCGVPLDPPGPAADLAALPPPRADGSSCRAQAAAYAAVARRAGFAARTAVGVAHDGDGFVWHAWTEVRTSAGWAAIDPAFGQAPARGPRFTVARHGEDAGSREAAGRRILACWGRAVE